MKRFCSYFLVAVVIVLLLGFGSAIIYIISITRKLPDYEVLKNYEPAVVTRIHASDGKLMGEFAKKTRLYMPLRTIPDSVKAAFISAEDRNFYQHFGLDFIGLFRAIVNNIKSIGSGRRPEGASTITQQVAKNFLLTSDTTIDRKIKEAVLALRIEKTYSKEHILELYLNEIYLGRGAYGIAAAALIYFNKSVGELSLEEIAYLAALPKGPGNYDPFNHVKRAIIRRNWVIDRMVSNRYVRDKEEAEVAKSKPINAVLRGKESYVFAAEYFTEEVRRQLISRYGTDTLYEKGLSVRTTLNPELQVVARYSLQNALIQFDQNMGWRGAYTHTNLVHKDWRQFLTNITPFEDVPEWQLAIVLEVTRSFVKVGIRPLIETSGKIESKRQTGEIIVEDMKWALKTINKQGQRKLAKDPTGVLKIGDVIFVQKKKGTKEKYLLQQPPKIQGAMIVMEPVTGRILAMIGGFSYSQSEFNRATQAYRQPGSAFKPFVYAAALDNGYTPASVVLDGPVEIDQGGLGTWRPKNYSGTFAGPSTLRYGIEYSRNLMTVRLANDLGMSVVAEYAERFGIYDKMKPVLSMSLGAGETTVLKLVTAYSIIANGGRSIEPSMIDRIQDRYGNTIYHHDKRQCKECNVHKWDNQMEPLLLDKRDQVLDPMTAYQITSMMEGVVQRGTAMQLRSLQRPIAGKTGTTNDAKDAWFIGFTPDMVVGVFMGFDIPASLGSVGTGGSLAAPVFSSFIEKTMKGKPKICFHPPHGMMQIAINRQTGMYVQEHDENIIIEAFKPGTGPANVYQVIGGTESFQEGVRVPLMSPQINHALKRGRISGLY